MLNPIIRIPLTYSHITIHESLRNKIKNKNTLSRETLANVDPPAKYVNPPISLSSLSQYPTHIPW